MDLLENIDNLIYPWSDCPLLREGGTVGEEAHPVRRTSKDKELKTEKFTVVKAAAKLIVPLNLDL